MSIQVKENCVVGLEQDRYLGDHCVQGLPAVPGTFYIQLAREAVARAVGAIPMALEAIQFKNIVFLNEGETHDLAIDVNCVAGEVARVTISSGDAGRGDAGDVNAEMIATFAAAPILGTIDVDALKGAVAPTFDTVGFYERLAGRGNQYGTAFQGVQEVWCQGQEALGAIGGSEVAVTSGDALHPAIVDAAIQLISATHENSAGETYVVTGLKAMRFAPNGRPAKWAHARLVRDERGQGGVVEGDVFLADEAGQIIAALEGVGLRYLDNAGSADQADAANIAVAATFTADLLEEPIAFWGRELDTPLKTTLAPYNQIFQQFLDPGSPFAQNKKGLNVALIRYDDWLGEATRFAQGVDEAERERILSGLKQHKLPGNLEIAHLNQYETEYVYKEIFVDRCYMKGDIELNDGDVVFDIGANIGLFSLFVTQEVSDAKIFSFEPSPQTFECLRANLSIYGSDVTPINCGISDRERIATFTHYENSSVFSGFRTDEGRDEAAIRAIVTNMVEEASELEGDELEETVDELMSGRLESQAYQCQLKPVSQIIREHNVEKIDLLKIDAEGSELDVLNGISEPDWGKIRQIAIEVHDREGPLVKAVMERLEAHGFEMEIIEEHFLQESGLYNIFARRPEDLKSKSTGARISRTEQIIERNIADLKQALESANGRHSVPTLIMSCPPRASFDFAKAEARLAEAVADIANCEFVGYETWSGHYPVRQIHDIEADRLGHIPYAGQLFTALGTAIARHHASMTRAPYKVLVLDCDNTLWRGIAGEDGADGVVIDAPFQALQSFAIRQAEAGMLLALVSKNAPEDVEAVFDYHTDMPLKMAHTVATRINWERKSDNIRSIAKELNLGLDSFIFIDDNPVECAEVRAALPEVLTLQLPGDAERIEPFLNHIWAFDRGAATTEDRKRNEHYRQEKKRESLRQRSMTLKDFIDSLDLKIEIADLDEERMARASQMTQRTNQFNCTTRRRSETEMRQFAGEADTRAMTVSVRDRFGDYGVVALALCRVGGDRLDVDTLLMSCRVLGRGVEYRLLSHLGEIAAAAGCSTVAVAYHKTAKNEPALKFLDAALGGYETLGGADEKLFVVPADTCAQIRYEPDNASGDVGEDTAQSDAGSTTSGVRINSERVNLIGDELTSVEAIVERMSAQRGKGRRGGTVELPTGSDLERSIAAIWQDVLGLERVGLDDRYAEVGGTSLKAVQIVARLKRECGLSVSLVDLYEHPTIASLAHRFGAGNADQHMEAKATRERGERRRQRLGGGRRSRRQAAEAD